MKLRSRIGNGLLALGLIGGYTGIGGFCYYESKRFDLLKDTEDQVDTLNTTEDYRTRSTKFFLLHLVSGISVFAGTYYSLERRVSQ